MKLQKRFTRRIGDKEYSKWVVTIAPEDVEKLGWRKDDELESKIKGHSLTLVPKHEVVK